jgi:hypothetical protein
LGPGDQPVDVLLEPEDRRPARRRVHADPLEDRRAVVQRVRERMEMQLVIVEELTILPHGGGGPGDHGAVLSEWGKQNAPAVGRPGRSLLEGSGLLGERRSGRRAKPDEKNFTRKKYARCGHAGTTVPRRRGQGQADAATV